MRKLKRQGAFYGNIDNICWDEIYDVRGFDPNTPRYYAKPASSPVWTNSPCAGRKRTRDTTDTDGSNALLELLNPTRPGDAYTDVKKYSLPSKRQRVTRAAPVKKIRARRLAGPRSTAPECNDIRRLAPFFAGVVAGVSIFFS